MHIGKAQMLQQPGRIIGVKAHAGGDCQVVVGLADAAMIEDHDLIVVSEAARQMIMRAMAVRAPPPHQQQRRPFAMDLVVHLVVVDRRDRHDWLP